MDTNILVAQKGIIQNNIQVNIINLNKNIVESAAENSLKAFCKDIVLNLAGKLAENAINYILTGSTEDPTVALLNEINSKLDALKSIVEDIPYATATCEDYNTAINQAKDKIRSVNEVLNYDSKRNLYDTYENYLKSLQVEQWENLFSLLTNNSNQGNDYYTLIDNILNRVYSVSLSYLLETKPEDLVFINSDNSYAAFINKATLRNSPVGLTTYMNSQIDVMTGVLDTVAYILTTSLKVYNLLRDISQKPEVYNTLSKDIQDKITIKLGNKVLEYLMPADNNLPVIYNEIKTALSCAPLYICGNASTVYLTIQESQNVTIKNSAKNSYLGVNTNSSYPLQATYVDQPCNWTIGFDKDSGADMVKLNSGSNFLFTVGSTIYNSFGSMVAMSGAVYAMPLTQYIGGSPSFVWKLSVVSTGERQLGMIFTNPGVDDTTALVNYIPLLGSDYVGTYKLDQYDGDHQWIINPA